MNVSLSLTFGTTEGKLFTMRVPNAMNNVGSPAVKDAMDKLIESNCIETKRGDLASREKARILRVTSENFAVN